MGVSFEKQYNSMSLDKYLQEMPQASQKGWQFFLEAFEFLSDNAQLTYPLQNVKSKNSIDKLKNSNDCIFLSGEHMDQTRAQCLGLKIVVILVCFATKYCFLGSEMKGSHIIENYD